MRADHDVDAAFGEAFDRLLRFLSCAEAGELRHGDGPVGEAVLERGGVLLCEQRRRAEHRHLLAAHHSNEGGAKRHFGFAEADVAADEAVHGFPGGHVGDDGFNGGALVGRFLKGKAFAEALVVGRVYLEADAFARLAQRI